MTLAISAFLASSPMLMHAILLWRRGRISVFEPLVTFYSGMFIVFTIQLFEHQELLLAWHDRATINEALFIIFMSIIWVIAGYEMSMGRLIGDALPKPPSNLARGRFFFVCIVVFSAGIFSYLLTFSYAGGITSWASAPRGMPVEGISGYISMLEYFVPAAIMMALFFVEMNKKENITVRIFVWFLAFFILIWFLYLGSRSRTIGWVFVIFGAIFLTKGRNPPVMLVLALGLVLYPVANFLGQNRDHFRDFSFNFHEIDWSTAIRSALPQILYSKSEPISNTLVGRGLEVNVVIEIVDLVPETYDYMPRALLHFVTSIVPRQWWPEKPYPLFEEMTPVWQHNAITEDWKYLGDEPFLVGPAIPFSGFWYAVGGPIFMSLGCAMTGVMFRVANQFWIRDRTGQGTIILFFAMGSVGLAQVSAPLFFIFYFPFQFLPLMAAVWFSGQRHVTNTKITLRSQYPYKRVHLRSREIGLKRES